MFIEKKKKYNSIIEYVINKFLNFLKNKINNKITFKNLSNIKELLIFLG